MKATMPREMTEAMQVEIDGVMKTKYGAERSCVTDKQFVKTGERCWTCAYAESDVDSLDKPALFMVHWVQPSGNFDGTYVIYVALDFVRVPFKE